MSLEVTVHIPSFPTPEYDDKYREGKGENVTLDRQPILRAESYDSIDGYGIAGGDMRPGMSWTFNANRDFIIRMLYLRKGKSEYPLFVLTHPRNNGRVHLSWILGDSTEHGGVISPGMTADLCDWWTKDKAWIIEAKVE